MNDRLIVVAGVVLCSLGIGVMVVPAASAGIPTVVLTAFALAVVAGSLFVAASRLETASTSVDLPEPERRPQYRPPGAAFEARLDSVGLLGRRAVSRDEPGLVDGEPPRERLREELRGRAVTVVQQTTGCTRTEALSRLDEGRWTDDRVAAAFFADGLVPSLPLRQRLPVPSNRELPTVRRARRAVAALEQRLSESSGQSTRSGPDHTPTTAYWPTADLPVSRSTGGTTLFGVSVLVLSGLGVVANAPGLVLIGTVGIALAATAKFTRPETSLAFSRSVEPESPAPGTDVTVTVTVENDGERTLPDLRVIDGVPAGLTVTDGSPRFATALRPGRAATFSYTVRAVNGDHEFEPAIAIASDFVGVVERVESVADSTTLSCGFERAAGDAPTPEPLSVLPGPFEGQETGSGVEFETIREYRPGDPPARIDWHRRAKTGELATREFVEPTQIRTVLLIDDRPAAYVATAETVPAPRASAQMAFAVGARLLDDGQPVGLSTVTATEWLPPRAGETQYSALRRSLADSEAVRWTAPAESRPVDAAAQRLSARLAADTQVVFFSPLADNESVELCRRLDAAGHDVSVLSPAYTDGETTGAAYARLARWCRRSELHAAEIPVEGWQPNPETGDPDDD